MKKRRKIIVAGMLLMFFALVAFVVFGCSLRTITWEGNTNYTEEELSQYFQQKTVDYNTILFYFINQYGKQKKIPFVQEYEVNWVDFHTVHVTIYEKGMIGCISYMEEYLFFDRDGIIVGSGKKQKDGVPLVTGIAYRKLVLNEAIETSDAELFSILMTLTGLIHKYELSIDEITFNSKYEITLKTGDIKILLGNKESYNTDIAELNSILPKAEGMKGTLNMKEFSKSGDRIIFTQEE